MAVQGQTDPSPTGPSPVESSPPWTIRQVLAGLILILGFNLIAGLAHIQGVMATATRRGYDYDFRYAALVIVGITIAYAGLLCLWAVRGLARGQRAAWDRALSGTLLPLLVSIPLIPVDGPGQDNAVSTAIPSAVILVLLLATRHRFEAG